MHALAFDGIYGVWLCGIFSGLAFGAETTCPTFVDRVLQEISYRERLCLETLENMRREDELLWESGMLTLKEIRDEARRLRDVGGPTKADLEAARLSYKDSIRRAFAKASEKVKRS